MNKRLRAWYRFMAYFLVTLILVQAVGTKVIFAENLPAEEGENLQTIPFSYEKEGVILTVSKINEWEGGYQGEIIITNQNEIAIKNWSVSLVIDDQIVNAWGADWLLDGEASLFSALEYNGIIESGESVTIGYQTNGNLGTIKEISLESELLSDDSQEQGIILSEVENESYQFVFENYMVEYIITSFWKENCNVKIRITNISDEIINNWNLKFESEDAISEVYGAEMICEEGDYTFYNMGYNQDIASGETIEFGFLVCYGERLDLPQEFDIDIAQNKLEEGYNIENVVTNKWDTGYTGEITITNSSEVEIQDWYLLIENQDEFVDIWGGTLEYVSEGLYGICCPHDSQNIAVGESCVIGYRCEGINSELMKIMQLDERKPVSESDESESGSSSESESTPKPEEEIEQIVVIDKNIFEETSTESKYLVESEITSLTGYINQIKEVQQVKYYIQDCFEEVVLEGILINGNQDSNLFEINPVGLILGWNRLTFEIEFIDGNIKNEYIDIINMNTENMKKTSISNLDSDGDGITDYYEKYFATSPELIDSDGDGLSDFDELFVLYTDPVLSDADNNGIVDALDDSDEDGLTTVEEMELGTYAYMYDSDADGLSDGFERNTTLTDPLKYDSDGDGYSDGEEYNLGIDPMSVDSDSDGINDYEELIFQKESYYYESNESTIKEVSVEFDCKGLISDQIYYSDTLGINSMLLSTPGMIGEPINIDVVPEFETAKLSFYYDESKLGDTKEEDLCMMWYDEENNEYVLLEDSYCDPDNNCVIYNTTHFSIYFLVDKTIWLEAEQNTIDYMTYNEEVDTNYDIVFVLDYTVSQEELLMQEEIAENVVEQMVDGDRILFLYCTNNGISCRMSNGKYTWNTTQQSAKQAISMTTLMEALAGIFHHPTESYDGCIEFSLQAVPMVMDDNENEKIAYICYPGNKYDSLIRKYLNDINESITDAISENITINTISINNSESAKLSDMIKETGGTSYEALDSESAGSVSTSIEGKLSARMDNTIGKFDETDADSDGFPDVYEVNGMKTSNNCIIYTDKDSADTDNDGYSDYDEMGGVPNEDGVFSQISDPNDPASYPGAKNIPGYIVVDSLDYYSFSEQKLNEIYRDEVKIQDPEDGHYFNVLNSKGEQVYGLNSVYYSNINELSDIEYGFIVTRATIQCIGAGATFPYASKFLWWYIENSSYIHEYNAKYFLPISQCMRNSLAHDTYYIVEAALNNIEKGESIILATSNVGAGNGIGLNVGSDVKTVLFNPEAFLAIGSADTACTARISYDEHSFYIDMKYYILDYYDWDYFKNFPVPLVSDNEMWRLCRDGQAKFYQNVGIAEFHLAIPYLEESENYPNYVSTLIKSEALCEFPLYILEDMDYEAEQEYIRQLLQPT